MRQVLVAAGSPVQRFAGQLFNTRFRRVPPQAIESSYNQLCFDKFLMSQLRCSGEQRTSNTGANIVRFLFNFVVTCVFALAALTDGPELAVAQSPIAQSLGEAIQPLLRDHKGDVAVAVYHFESDTHWSHNGDKPMPTASLIKLPVMIEAYRKAEAGEVDLDRRIELRKEDMVQGSGILTSHFSPGTAA